MKKTLGIFLLLASAHLCLGQSGQITFPFDAETAPVYDVTGEYLFLHDASSGGQTLPIGYYLGVNLEANGRIRSFGGTTVKIGDSYVAALYDVVGSVTGGGGSPTRVNFSVRLKGYDWVAGAARHFSLSLTYRLVVNPADSTLTGTVQGSVYVQGVGSARIKPATGEDNVSVPLPDGANGSWSLTLNIISAGHIGGTGTFTISDYSPPDNPAGFPTDRLLPANVSGSYSQHTGFSKVSVRGIYDGRGSTLSLTYNPADNSVINASGKVLGQLVRMQQAPQ